MLKHIFSHNKTHVEKKSCLSRVKCCKFISFFCTRPNSDDNNGKNEFDNYLLKYCIFFTHDRLSSWSAEIPREIRSIRHFTLLPLLWVIPSPLLSLLKVHESNTPCRHQPPNARSLRPSWSYYKQCLGQSLAPTDRKSPREREGEILPPHKRVRIERLPLLI